MPHTPLLCPEQSAGLKKKGKIMGKLWNWISGKDDKESSSGKSNEQYGMTAEEIDEEEKNFFERAGGWLDNAVDTVVDSVEDVVDWAEDTVEDVKDWAEDKVDDAKDWVNENIVKEVKEAVAEKPQTFKQAVKTIYKMNKDIASNIYEDVEDTTKTVYNNAKDNGKKVYSRFKTDVVEKAIGNNAEAMAKYNETEARIMDKLNQIEEDGMDEYREVKNDVGNGINEVEKYVKGGYNKVEDFAESISDKWDNYLDWRKDNTEKLDTFISQNKDQLNVKTETYKTVKDVYKGYREQGIDINQFDVTNYVADLGVSDFVDMVNSSTMLDADMYPNGVFWTEEDANIAYAQQANPITIADNRETGNIIIKVPVTMEDANGGKYTVNMYTTDDIYEGMEGNVITGTAARIAAYTMDPFNPIEVSVTHTHPVSGWDNKFSRGLVGDELVARWPGVDKMYVADVETGSLLMFDESMPNTIFKKLDNDDYKYNDYEFDILPDGTLPHIP